MAFDAAKFVVAVKRVATEHGAAIEIVQATPLVVRVTAAAPAPPVQMGRAVATRYSEVLAEEDRVSLRAGTDDPTVIALARKRRQTPEQFLAWLHGVERGEVDKAARNAARCQRARDLTE